MTKSDRPGLPLSDDERFAETLSGAIVWLDEFQIEHNYPDMEEFLASPMRWVRDGLAKRHTPPNK